jgi:cyclopropane-fatty-acyl-phospholipid synthase
MTEPVSLSAPFAWADLASGVSARIARSLVISRLEELQFGELSLVDEHGTHVFGGRLCGPKARVHVKHPAAWTAIALGGSLGAGESYMDGLWSADDLVATVQIMIGASTRLSDLDGSGLGVIRSTLDGLYHRFRRNSKAGSRRNIAEHYDLGNDFYRLWLDESMMYSSAVWENEQMTLEEAQQARLERVCKKLALRPTDHLLEIGTGWGAMAIYAASRFGCRVTTTTISEEQYACAQSRVHEAGLDDRVTVLLEDYRDLRGSYDKVVSIEMIEAVGAEYLEAYFAQIGRVLVPEGLALIQAITIPDDRFDESVGRMDFIKRHIFPGGQLPSVHAMSSAWRRQTQLRLLHLEDFGEHYARTLHEWRERFHARSGEVETLGYSPRFVRMWDFYLASCEGAFLERHCGVAQLLLAGPKARRAPVLGRISDAGSS